VGEESSSQLPSAAVELSATEAAGLSVVAASAESPGAADGVEPRAGANRVEPFVAGASERLESMPASVEGSDAASASVALAESEAETAASVPVAAPEAVGAADATAATAAVDAAGEVGAVDAVDPVEAAVALDAAGEVVAAEALDAAEAVDATELAGAADSATPRRVATSRDVSLVLRVVEPSVEGAASVAPAFAGGTAAVLAAAESDASVDLSWALRL